MICYVCGRRLKRAAATVPGEASFAMGPVCARKAVKRMAADSLFRPAFDLDRACAEARGRVNAFIAHRAREILLQLRGRA